MNTVAKIGIGMSGLVLVSWLAGTRPASATMDMQKKAKAAGIAVQNCQYCHVDKLPKKGAAAENERGKFLVAQKEKRGAKEVDVEWLKDYKEDKK